MTEVDLTGLLPEEPVAVSNLILLEGFLPPFRIGATVRLKSGSPLLTVTAVQEGHAEVQWFEGTAAKQKIYPVGALQVTRRKRGIHV
jgi:uncharacterized protein YodC (DUF2158 family)